MPVSAGTLLVDVYVKVSALTTVIVYVPATRLPVENVMSTWSPVTSPWATALTVTVVPVCVDVLVNLLPPAGRVVYETVVALTVMLYVVPYSADLMNTMPLVPHVGDVVPDMATVFSRFTMNV